MKKSIKTQNQNSTKTYPKAEDDKAKIIADPGQYGYMSGDEFERRVMEGLEKRLRDNGYL